MDSMNTFPGVHWRW